MNPVMALGMKSNAVRRTCGTTHHTGDAVMKPPACDPGDFLYGTECKVHVVHTRDSEEYGYPETEKILSGFLLVSLSKTPRIDIPLRPKNFPEAFLIKASDNSGVNLLPSALLAL